MTPPDPPAPSGSRATADPLAAPDPLTHLTSVSSAGSASPAAVVGYEPFAEESFGGEGYLRVRRVHLRNVRADGSRSRPYFCELVDRPRHGTDAVVVALWHRDATLGVHVLLRQGLRPALAFGRPRDRLPVADARPYLLFTEVVAGILEDGDCGEEGIRQRAALEAFEEAGLRVPAERFARLGGKVFPTPGMAPECFHLFQAEVDPAAAEPPAGDGSPMEEGCVVMFVPLAAALARCDCGDIEDAKTELALRRLHALLLSEATAPPSAAASGR